VEQDIWFKTFKQMTRLEEKYNKLLLEYDVMSDKDPKKRFIFKQLECMSGWIAHYSSDAYLNRKPLLREIAAAEKPVQSIKQVQDIFGIQS